MDDGTVRGREGLVGWIGQTRSLLPDLHFTIDVGPIVDGDTVAGRWLTDGTNQGGFPSATASPGTGVGFHGNDIWRAEGGMVREYRLSDDTLDLLTQLGAFPAG